MARRTKEDAEKTRELIIYAALDIFCEKGYSKTTFDEIAKRINFTKGAIYWHFRNKPDLLIAIIKTAFGKVQEHLMEKVPHINNLNDLKEYFLYDAELIKNHADFRKFLFFAIFQMEWSDAIYNKVNNSLADIRDFPLKQIKETLTLMQKSGEIAPDANISEVSEMFLCFWKGAINNELSNTSTVDFISFIGKGFDLIIGGLKEER